MTTVIVITPIATPRIDIAVMIVTAASVRRDHKYRDAMSRENRRDAIKEDGRSITEASAAERDVREGGMAKAHFEGKGGEWW